MKTHMLTWVVVLTMAVTVFSRDNNLYNEDSLFSNFDTSIVIYSVADGVVFADAREITGDFASDLSFNEQEHTELATQMYYDSVMTFIELACPDIYTEEEYFVCPSIYKSRGPLIDSIKLNNTADLIKVVDSAGSKDYIFFSQAVNGCDSIHTVHYVLGEKNPVPKTRSVSACDSFFVKANSGSSAKGKYGKGLYIRQSGVYRSVVTDTEGCDSIIDILDLTVNKSYWSSIDTTVNVCNGFLFDDSLYTHNTLITNYSRSLNGCDSVTLINLQVRHPSYSSNADTFLVYDTIPIIQYDTVRIFDTLTVQFLDTSYVAYAGNNLFEQKPVTIYDTSHITIADTVKTTLYDTVFVVVSGGEVYYPLEGSGVVAAPNPTSGSFSLSVGGGYTVFRCMLVTFTGEHIEQYTGPEYNHCSIDSPAGNYLLLISGKSSEGLFNGVIPIVKQKL